MPDLLIDVSRLLDRSLQRRLHTGVDRVCLAYVRHFRDAARAAVFFQNCLWIFPQSVSRRLFDLILDPPKRTGLSLLSLVLRWGPSTWFPQNLRNALLLNLGHSNLDRPAYLRSLRRRRIRLVSFVHDLIPITHPEYCRPEQHRVHSKRMLRALSLSAGIIANSHQTLLSLQYFADSQGVPLPPAVHALLAPDPLPPPDRQRPFQDPYFVMVGTIEPRKNHAFLLQLWRQLALEAGHAHTPHLVLIGQRGWECENSVDLLERCPALIGRVHEINRCSDRDMATFLHHAQALLFPSFAEGFGLPVAEALAPSVPVIASDLPVFREFAGPIPDYLQPLDGPRWLATISNYSRPDSPLRSAQLKRLPSFSPPSWQTHFRAIDRLLSQISTPSPPQLAPP